MARSNSSTPISKHIPVHLSNNETYKILQAYSEITGVPICRVVEEAAADWLHTIGKTRIEMMTRPHNRLKIEQLLKMLEPGPEPETAPASQPAAKVVVMAAAAEA